MQKLIEGLHKFQNEVFPLQRERFRELSKGQHPETLFITCSDSRINPNQITQTDPGDLFILRNAGNLVPPYSPATSGEAATIEFAVSKLGVSHIVVCGHTLCGAMKGLMEPESVADSPHLSQWLQYGEPTRRLVADNYGHLSPQDRITVLTEENVLAQVENLRTLPSVRSRLKKGDLSIHAWVLKIQTGQVFQFDPVDGQYHPLADEARSVENHQSVRRIDAVLI